MESAFDAPRFRGLSTTPRRGWLIPESYCCDRCRREVSLAEIPEGQIPIASPAVPAVSVFHDCGTLVFSRIYSTAWVSAFRRHYFVDRSSDDHMSYEDYWRAWDLEALRLTGWQYHPGLGPTPEPRDITLDWGVLLPLKGVAAMFAAEGFGPSQLVPLRTTINTKQFVRRVSDE